MPPPQQAQEKQPIFDAQSDWRGGMDASQSPELIQPNQISLGVNVTMRGAYPGSRPAFNNDFLDFAGDTEAEAYWNANLFQGAAYYNLNGNFPAMVASVGGHIFNLMPQGAGFEVTDITPYKAGLPDTLDPNSAWLAKAYFCQAATYLIIQDGQSAAFIFDGSVIRRANPGVPEVPAGTIMAYGQGRLIVGSGNQFLVGDIYGGATNVISFTETTYLNGGGAFLLPQNMGNITGMIFQAQQDTDTGQGTLLVFGQTGVISVNLAIPRTQWQTTQIVTVSLTDIGTLSDRTLTTINADILFRSQDGIRSYRDARAEFGPYSVGNFGRTAMSYEINNYLSTDFIGWQPFTSGIVFDNRYLVTTLPTMPTYQVPVFQAIAVMDFITVSALRYNQPPTFDGLWTGLNIYQLVTGLFASAARGFAFVRAVDGNGNQLLQLWEISTTPGPDNGNCPVSSAIETKAFIFGNNLQYKRMEYARYWADQIQGLVNWALRIKPDQYPGWILWQEWSDNGIAQACPNNSCAIPNYQPQYRAGRNLVLAPEACITDGSPYNWTAKTGFAFQFRWEWTGQARLTKTLYTAFTHDLPKLACLEAAPPFNPIPNLISAAPVATVYYNQEVTYECPAGTQGDYVVPAGEFSSTISQSDANAQALAYAQEQACCVPLVTSQSLTEKAGVAFAYQIQAGGSPTSYGATDLPTGLSLNATTGIISGTVATPKVYTIGLSATNPCGTGNGTLTLNIITPSYRVSQTTITNLPGGVTYEYNTPADFTSTEIANATFPGELGNIITGNTTSTTTSTRVITFDEIISPISVVFDPAYTTSLFTGNTAGQSAGVSISYNGSVVYTNSVSGEGHYAPVSYSQNLNPGDVYVITYTLIFPAITSGQAAPGEIHSLVATFI